jgi:hypothetical protein
MPISAIAISINGLLGALPQKDRFQSVGIDYG